jgi:hypothetical protein
MRGLCERDGHMSVPRGALTGPAPQCIRVHAYATLRLLLDAYACMQRRARDTYTLTPIFCINKHRVQVLHGLYDGEAIDETM